MRKVIYAMSVSLDGFIESVDGDISWTTPDTQLDQHIIERERSIGVYLNGRRIYELMSAFWPTADQNPLASEFEIEYARIWRDKPKLVFSKTLTQVGWNARLVRGDIAAEVNRLKEQPGGDLEVSGAGLGAAFMQLGLIDEYWLYIRPIILGGGKPMLAPLRDRSIPLQLVETRPFDHGVVLLKYQIESN